MSFEDQVNAFKEALKDGKNDIHRECASIMFDVKYEDVTASQRAQAKNENFPYLYLMNLNFEAARKAMLARAEIYAEARRRKGS